MKLPTKTLSIVDTKLYLNLNKEVLILSTELIYLMTLPFKTVFLPILIT